MSKLSKVLAAAFYGVLGGALFATGLLTYKDGRWAFAFILVCLVVAWIVSEDYRHEEAIRDAEIEAAQEAEIEAAQEAEIEAAVLRHPAGRGTAHVPSQTTPQTAEDATPGDF